MADRRPDDSSVAPRRSLSGRAKPSQESTAGAAKRQVADKVSATVSAVTGSGPAKSTEQAPADKGSKTGTSPRARPPGRPATAKRPAAGASGHHPRRTRKARLRLVHVDPWSVMKTAFLLSIAFGIVTVVAVALVWSVLGAAGVWDSINDTVRDVIGSQSSANFDVETYLGTSRVMGFTMIVAVVDVVLITAIATLGAFLYNLSAALLGGIDVTLAEDDH